MGYLSKGCFCRQNFINVKTKIQNIPDKVGVCEVNTFHEVKLSSKSKNKRSLTEKKYEVWPNNDEEKNGVGQTVKLILAVQTDLTIQVKRKISHSSKEVWCSHQTPKLYLNQQLSYSQS